MSQELFVSPRNLAQMPGLPPVLAEAWMRAYRNDGLIVGAFLKRVPLEGLDELMSYGRRVQTDFEARMNFGLFAVMLANCEGLTVLMEDNLSLLVRRLLLMVQVEMLFRKGRVELDHGALTLADFDPSDIEIKRNGHHHYTSLKVVKRP